LIFPPSLGDENLPTVQFRQTRILHLSFPSTSPALLCSMRKSHGVSYVAVFFPKGRFHSFFIVCFLTFALFRFFVLHLRGPPSFTFAELFPQPHPPFFYSVRVLFVRFFLYSNWCAVIPANPRLLFQQHPYRKQGDRAFFHVLMRAHVSMSLFSRRWFAFFLCAVARLLFFCLAWQEYDWRGLSYPFFFFPNLSPFLCCSRQHDRHLQPRSPRHFSFPPCHFFSQTFPPL